MPTSGSVVSFHQGLPLYSDQASLYNAINYGIACNTAGGSHHANYDGGAGYCVFNDRSKILVFEFKYSQTSGEIWR